MSYTVPNFNLLADVWDSGHNPAANDPDEENVPCQFYLYSRGTFDVQPCELELYTPPIWLRFPKNQEAIVNASQVFEVPAESGRYYRARFKERMHQGFPNEYLIVVVVQCNDEGVPLVRDIENAEPCESPPPEAPEATGGGAIVGELTSQGSAQRGPFEPPGGEHESEGSGTIQGSLTGAGGALRTTP